MAKKSKRKHDLVTNTETTVISSLADGYILANGVQIPCVGFGTWQIPDGETAVKAVQEALSLGYCHIDTAAAYNNEKSVGFAVRTSGLPRKSIFVTSKLANSDHGRAATEKAFERTLDNLGLEYLDLYLIHWPNPLRFRDRWQQVNAESWQVMEALYQSGRIRAIGVSNFLPHHLDELRKTAEILPMVNQIRFFIGNTQNELTAFFQARDILVEAYSPLATGAILRSKEIVTLAEHYQVSVPQICIRYALQRGTLPLPKSTHDAYIKANAQVDFIISEADMAYLNQLQLDL